MQIKELALATGVDFETIRYYEKQGLMPAHGVSLFQKPVRTPSLASNFHVQNDSAECKFACFGWKVT